MADKMETKTSQHWFRQEPPPEALSLRLLCKELNIIRSALSSVSRTVRPQLPATSTSTHNHPPTPEKVHTQVSLHSRYDHRHLQSAALRRETDGEGQLATPISMATPISLSTPINPTLIYLAGIMGQRSPFIRD